MYKLFNARLILSRKSSNLLYNRDSGSFKVRSSTDPVATNSYFFSSSNVYLRRYQSTITSPKTTLPNKSRNRAKTKQKYYDLLVVTDSETKQQKTSIEKLTSNDLRLLANTNFNLSELYKLKDLSSSSSAYVEEHTYNNLTIIDYLISPNNVAADNIFRRQNVEKIENNLIRRPAGDQRLSIITDEFSTVSPTIVESPDLLDSIPIINSFQPEILQADDDHHHMHHHHDLAMTLDGQPDHHKDVIVEINEPSNSINSKSSMKRDLERNHEIAYKTLASYLDICSDLRVPQRGLNALIFHNMRVRKSKDKNMIKMKNIRVYNALMKGFAMQGNWSKIEEVIRLLREENVDWNLQSFVSIFECLGRINVKDNYLKQIRIYAKEFLSNNNYTFNMLMNRGTFLYDQRVQVLKAITSYDPNFVPIYYKPKLQYNNHLVSQLNDRRQKLNPLITTNQSSIIKNDDYLLSPEFLKSQIQQQLRIEKDGYVTVKSIESRANSSSKDVQKYRELLTANLKYWEEIALKSFNRDLLTLTAHRSPLNYEPYMRSIPVKDFVTIIVEEARKISEGSETYSPTVNQLYRELGMKVYARYKLLRKQKTGVLDKVIKIHTRYCTNYASIHHRQLDIKPKSSDSERNFLNPRQQWQWCEFESIDTGATLSMDHREWSPAILQLIGKFLYHIVMYDLKIDINVMRPNSKHKNYLPAFYTVFRTQGRLVKEEIKPHPILSRLYRASQPETLTFAASDIPMLCPPVPWTSIKNGGYLVAPCDVIRLPTQATAQKQRLNRADPIDLYPSLDALNQLAAVPWKVNLKILAIILDVFNAGGSAKLDVPIQPALLTMPSLSDMGVADKVEKFKLFRQKLQHRRKKAEMYSLWCDCLYRLSLANHYRNDIFWLPHNMDFRGRVYPIPPHLNHLGSDLARSMLIFAEARPLGDEGLNWLKIHLINLTGLKKRDSIQDRLKYADDILDDIIDSADRPLTGKRWWCESDEPWQTLACCMEICDAIRSPNPTEFRSHFPIHQDGSCNGLQHYAALGRDSAGAFSVNLMPSKQPQDVYSAVVQLVEEQRCKDASIGVEVARILDGFVKRKVIKQTIMTTVYGVTRFGARLQIARQLKDIDSFPKDYVWAASAYLTARTFDSLRTMFTSTREIQDWFTDCARLISAVGGQHVEWITPLGLPIVQPYIRFKPLGDGGASMVYKPFHMDQYEKPNVMKQKNAFPPNFIHSLDSSHMMLTSLYCERAGITFVSVHDCYWTHPSTVHIMNKICREQFVALHSEPILENLSLFLSQKYSYNNEDFADDGSVTDLTKKKLNRILLQLPKTGDLDIRKVLESIYFFS